jgi:hypothetical protein
MSALVEAPLPTIPPGGETEIDDISVWGYNEPLNLGVISTYGYFRGEDLPSVPTIIRVFRTSDFAPFAYEEEDVTIQGNNFTGYTAVRFSNIDVTSNVSASSDTQLDLTNLTVPPGVYLVTVTTNEGVSNQFSFEILEEVDAEEGFTKITDHVQQAYNRILHQYKRPHLNAQEYAESTQVPKLLEALYSEGTQGLEDAAFSTINKLDIDNNEGAALDLIGEIVGQGRNNLADAEYRLYLKGKIALNSSNGTSDDIYQIWNAFSFATAADILEVFPAGIEIVTNTAPPADYLPIIRDYIDKALGVAISLVGIVAYDPTDAFQFAEGDTSITDPIHGFGDTGDPAIGGKLADLI